MSRKNNIAKVAIGDIVRVVFDDHAEVSDHNPEPIVFEVFGRILSKNKRSIVLSTWSYSGSSEVDSNTVQYTLLCSAMVSMTKLVPSLEVEVPNAKTLRKPKAKPTIENSQPPNGIERLGDAGRNAGAEECTVVPS